MGDPYLDPIKEQMSRLEEQLNISNPHAHLFRRLEALEQAVGLKANPLYPLDKRVDDVERKWELLSMGNWIMTPHR